MEYGRTLIAASVCAAVLLSLAASVTVSADTQADHRAQNHERLAPDFTLPAISDRNQTITLSAFRGKTVYLDFWSSWCAPCREALPLLNELREQLAGDDFEIVAVNLDAHPADGRRLMERYAITYPVASDITGIAISRFGATTLPAAYLISDEGVIQPELPPMDAQNLSAIKASLLELIERKSPTLAVLN